MDICKGKYITITQHGEIALEGIICSRDDLGFSVETSEGDRFNILWEEYHALVGCIQVASAVKEAA